MPYEQRDNSGTLFKNDDREKETHPHAKGKAMIGGVMYWVSAWTKDGAKGRFQSLSFKRMDRQPNEDGGGQQQRRQPSRAGSPFDGPPPSFENTPKDDLPF